jgi:hypothetical protein
VDAYLERGAKRVFAGAIDWPGWARAGKTDEAALDALAAYGSRYAAALSGTRLRFRAPQGVSDLHVVDRVEGTATTDFGAPDVAVARDLEDVDAKDLARLETILRAAWRTLDTAAERADGVELAKGPRGGGRALDAIVDHVLRADASYVARLRTQGRGRRRRGGPRRHRRRAPERRPRRRPAEPARGQAVDAPILRAPFRVARARPRVGDRGPHARVMRPRVSAGR